MKTLISPSKTLNFDDYNTPGFNTDCRLLDDTTELHKILTSYSINGIKDLMSVSDKIAELIIIVSKAGKIHHYLLSQNKQYSLLREMFTQV